MAAGKKRPSAPSSDDARRAAMRRALRELTQRYVADVMSLFQDALLLEAQATASAHEAETERRPRRDLRRLEAIAEDVVFALAGGVAMSVSQLAAAVGTVPRELAHPIARLVRAGTLVKHGERKGTRYTLALAKPPKRAPRAKGVASSTRPRPKRSGATSPGKSTGDPPTKRGGRTKATGPRTRHSAKARKR